MKINNFHNISTHYMPKFKYTARTRTGKLQRGFLESKNPDELVDILQSRGLVVISYASTKKIQAKASARQRQHSNITIDDLIVLARQLTTLLNAGITLLRSLEISSEQLNSRRLSLIMTDVKTSVSGGSSLKVAMAKHPRVFSKFWVNIVATGETTGQLGFALEQLSKYLEARAAFKRKIVSAVMYPIVILAVAIVAILIFMIRIIPMFADIYSGFGAQLPLFTQIVFNISNMIKKYLILEVLVALGVVFMFWRYRKTSLGRRNTDHLLLEMPMIGTVIRQMEAVRFASALGILTKSGTPILHAMDIIIDSSDNVIVMDMLTKVKENVREGKAMAAPMIDAGIFPAMLSHMVSVGEESGELPSILENAVIFYQERVDTYVGRLTTLFEPVLIIVVGVIVGSLVIAMYLPIFGLSTAMH